MKLQIPFKWLLDYLETDLCMEDIIERMIMIGIEVEEVSASASNFFEIANIESVEPHPSAELSICIVNSKQIVCGDSTVRKGMRSILATPEAVIPASMKQIKVTKLRGVTSYGMLCSKAELLLEDESEGIIDLDRDFPGMNNDEILREILIPNGPVITVFITPNRCDLMSIYGIARELHCFGVGCLKTFSQPKYVSQMTHSSVQIDNNVNSVVSMHAAHLSISKVSHSQSWLKRRLFDSGIKHKCLFSDIAAYILHAFGQQIELFDFEKTGQIQITHLKNIDLEGIKLSQADCIISKKDGTVISIPGVLPNKESPSESKSVLMLAARYDELALDNIINMSRKIDPNFSKNFNRATDTEVSRIALYEACLLIQKMTDCKIDEMTEAKPMAKNLTKGIKMPEVSFIKTDIDFHQILVNLGFELNKEGEYVQPRWRTEIMLDSSDLLEEILRYTGFECVQEDTAWSPKIFPKTNDIYYLVYFLTRLGMTEVSNLHFMSKVMSKVFEPAEDLIITNPMKKEKQHALRNSILVGIIETLGKYFRNNWKLPGIFEIGKVFEQEEEYEALGVAILPTNFCQWHSSSDSQYFKAKEIFETCVESVIQNTRQAPSDRKILINGCAWIINGVKVAEFGELDTSLFPYIFGKSKIKEPIYIGEINIDRAKNDFNQFICSDLSQCEYKPCQSVIERDVSFCFIESNYFADAINELKCYLEDKSIVFTVFDVYPSAIISDKSRSVTLRLTWMLPYSPTTEEINNMMSKIEELLYKNGCIIKEK